MITALTLQQRAAVFHRNENAFDVNTWGAVSVPSAFFFQGVGGGRQIAFITLGQNACAAAAAAAPAYSQDRQCGSIATFPVTFAEYGQKL